MNRIEPNNSMTKLSKMELRKTQPGSEPIEVRAGFAENNHKPQRQRHLGSAQMQTRNRSQEMNDPAAIQAITRRAKQSGDRRSRFHLSNQNPTAHNQNRQTAFSTTRH